MNSTELDDLVNVLVGYFGDRSRAEGLDDLLAVTVARTDYHQRYRAALVAGIDALRSGDLDALRAVRRLAPSLPDLASAETRLRSILADYDRGYATRSTGC